MKSLLIEDRPYLATKCEVPTTVPTKLFAGSIASFFIATTLGIIAFMRYNDTHVVLKSHHEAEMHKLLLEVEQYKTLLETRTKESDSKAALLLESLKKVDPNLESIKEWKQVRPPVQLEGIDDGYELVETPK